MIAAVCAGLAACAHFPRNAPLERSRSRVWLPRFRDVGRHRRFPAAAADRELLGRRDARGRIRVRRVAGARGGEGAVRRARARARGRDRHRLERLGREASRPPTSRSTARGSSRISKRDSCGATSARADLAHARAVELAAARLAGFGRSDLAAEYYDAQSSTAPRSATCSGRRTGALDQRHGHDARGALHVRSGAVRSARAPTRCLPDRASGGGVLGGAARCSRRSRSRTTPSAAAGTSAGVGRARRSGAAIRSRGRTRRRCGSRSTIRRTPGPYVHLLDGALADNLGLRSTIEKAVEAGGYAQFARAPASSASAASRSSSSTPRPGRCANGRARASPPGCWTC